MEHIIGTVIGIGLAYIASRWSYGRQLLELAKQGLGLAQATGLDDKIPERARKIAEDAILAANQREINELVEKLIAMQTEADAREKAATERGKQSAPPPENVTIVPLDGTEKWSKPFKD